MRNIKIAVLDTGYTGKSYSVKNKRQFYYDYYSNAVISNDIAEDYNGHGNMCINTILREFTHVDIYVVKMLNISGLTNNATFAKALEYANELDVDIIAICASFITKITDGQVEKLCNTGKIIIASVQNDSKTSPPACYPSVIGVVGGPLEDSEIRYNRGAEIQMQCSSVATITQGLNGFRMPFQGNSRATALASANIAKILYSIGSTDKNELTEYLNKNNFKPFSCEKYSSEFDNIFVTLFDKEKEHSYMETEPDYHKLVYMLCEFFSCDDPSIIRQVELINFEERFFLHKMESFLSLVDERFGRPSGSFRLHEMQWAYTFYENYIRRRNDD